MPAKAVPGVVVLAAVLVAACGPAATGSPGTSTGPRDSQAPSPSEAPVAALVLRITSEGGFIGPSANLATIPAVSVYADGRIMTPGAVDTIYPGPLLPVVAVRDVGPAGAAAIVTAIRAAGLDRMSTAGPGIPGDTGTTVFAINVDGVLVTTRIALGGGGPGIPGGGGNPDPAAAAAKALMDRLADPNETWGAANVVQSAFVPTGYRIYVVPGAPASDGESSQPAVQWPLSTPLDQFGVPANPDRGITGLRQGAAFGADAAALGPVLLAANSQTPFISGSNLYTLYVRPLLPDEVPA
jgi:hypothetical protein